MTARILAALTGLLLASAAQAAPLAVGEVQADAVPGLSGDLQITVGGLALADYCCSTRDTRGTIIAGEGRVNVWLGPQLSAQFDLSGERASNDLTDDDTVFNLATHLSWRRDNNLLGVFGSLGLATRRTGDGELPWWDWEEWGGGSFATAGVEGIVDLGPAQLYGQAGITKSLALEDDHAGKYDITAPYVRGEMRYFFTPDLMVSANAGYVHEVYDGPTKPIEAVTWGAGVDYRPDNSALVLSLAYQGAYETEPVGETDSEAFAHHSVLAGLKLGFGDDTLQAAARSGATLHDYNPITGVQHLRFNDWE